MLRYGTLRTRRGNDVAYAVLGTDRRDGVADAGGAPVFLVHPINLRKECWLGLLPALSGDRLCVMVDLAGHGESGDDGTYTLEGWVSDCLDVAASLRLDRFHLVGGSLGGAIALCLAAELPEQALSVTAMGSDLGDEPPGGPGLEAMLDSMTVDEMFARLAVEALAPDRPEALVTTVRHLTNAHGEPVVRGALRAAHTADATAWAPRVRCPTLVLTGEFDTACPPEAGRRMAAGVAGRHQILDGVGHLPMIEDPPAVLRVLLPHLEAAES
ncbi:alpha/beta fold hydrolase [Actinomadura madurae]|uniref:alpha/beta fold hydrolase n=1 Tax=Actinomadura madurae TaxID=1993 RepID=UPI0020270E90|nr:alpha/beta hydrolase [Actinomadura madurae]MCP9950915.1 alpha/beta hydrolase [Actinomadura madurae]MCP9967705.1 alpha/beta hydrolase [Actinomadura madurae]MCP9980149.1 alpha/beta hydrolase [Actinomadura madurae]MCQ0008323.1 alpha/beta hydrolase [Actinomadura madurae]MCQ0016363.1 alpha/beta hydrolase [Actinomadura madurae]